MIRYEDLNAYALADFACSCGMRHRTNIRNIVIAEDLQPHLTALTRHLLPDGDQKADESTHIGRLNPGQTVLLVADQRTWQAAGETACRQIKQLGVSVRQVCFPAEPSLVPDERAVFTVLNQMGPDISLLLAIGTGTINDLTRFVSHRSGIPYAIVATGPSMDGYASSVAALVVNSMKQTFSAWGAEAILAVPSVLAASPRIMIAAGLGDILGKYTAICDWRLTGMIDDEQPCDAVAELVLDTVAACRQQAGLLARRDQKAVTGLFEALILTGIAMSYVGHSRPASGCEHHLSHFWEMAFVRSGHPPVLHGSKVGLATLMTCALYRHLLVLSPDFAAARAQAAQFDLAAWIQRMTHVYGGGAAEIIELERQVDKHNQATVCCRLERIEACWNELCDLVRRTIPEPDQLRTVLRQVGGPVHPDELDISRDLVADSLRYAMEMRQTYTVLRLYAELGETETAVRLIGDMLDQ